MESSPDNPWGVIQSLEEGQEWLDRLELELLLVSNDLMNCQDHMSEIGKTAMSYTIEMTEKAIEKIKFEMKMFKE